MIELLINKRTRLPIVAKPAGSPWTAREVDGPNLCVVRMPRADLPAELAASLNRHRVAANPFAEYETAPACQGDAEASPACQGDAEASPATNLPRMVRQSTIELRPADVRPGASVRFADCAVSTIGNRQLEIEN